MCNSGISCLTWIGWVRHTHVHFWQVHMQDLMSNNRRIIRKLSARQAWITGIYKKKLPFIFQATKEVMF